jgi:glutamate-1-semialdehyde 2,1-aminomutase
LTAIENLREEFVKRTPKSLKCYEEAKKHLPLGVSSNLQFYEPYPIYWDHAEGSRFWDVDGNEYTDFNCAFGALMAGHSHPKLVEAAKEQLVRGTLYCAPSYLTAMCAEELKKRYPLDLVRFTNTGTEATMHSIRLARAYTGKNKIVKIEGCYHGMHDYMLHSIFPHLGEIGPDWAPTTVTQSKGIPPYIKDDILVVPYNDIDAMKDVFEKHIGEIAAVIIEPVMMNCAFIPPRDNYLKKVRKLTEKHNVVLIFDEVKTGFKLAYGGACEYFDIKPDLVTLAKCLGNGFSLAAFGGKREILERLEIDVLHGGTYGGNPFTINIALHSLKELMTKEKLEKAYKLEEKLAQGLHDLIKKHNIPGFVNSIGACGMIFLTEHDIYDYRTCTKYYDKEKFLKFWLGMVNNGIWLAPRIDEHWTVSIVHSDKDVDKFLSVFDKIAPTLV